MSNQIYNDAYKDYFIVLEQTTPQDNKISIMKTESNSLNFLRFKTCLQDFYGRNRNRRNWTSEIVRKMTEDKTFQELLRKGSAVGENGHPVPPTGGVTLERILTIDPNNCSHRIISLEWKYDHKELHAVIETLDEGVGSPGYRFMRNILQGIIPAFSLRSVVPQRKNSDGSVDVIGPGRLVCYDRVYLPSHEKAYMDIEIPVQNIISKPKFNEVMESYCDFVTSNSDKVRSIIDNMEPVMESASIDPKSSMVSMKTREGRIFIAPEIKYRREIQDIYNDFLNK